MRNHRVGLAIIVAAVCGLALASGMAEHRRSGRDFMRQKLAYSQGILEGITLEKYDLVISNAVFLRKMNLTNAFLELRNPTYLGSISNFQKSVNTLVLAAQDGNTESATEAYTMVARNCVACHQQFRREQFLKASSGR
jgi:hypothetical protein